MQEEQKFFLAVLGAFVRGERIAPRDGVCMDTVRTYAIRHQVQAIFAHMLRETPSALNSTADLAAASDFVTRRRFLHRLDEAFSENRIPYLIFKGTEIAAYYPVPALRSMGDCDILVREQDKERAGDLLLKMGFSLKEKENKEWLFSRKDLELELHHRLLYDEPANNRDALAFCDRVWDCAAPVSPGAYRHTLSPEYHFVYVLLHLKKHLLYQGAGFRQFLDIAFMDRNAGLDRPLMEQMLRETGMERFYRVCRELCDRWFYEKADETVFQQAFFEDVTGKIFRNGVFGISDGGNEDKKILNSVRRNGKLRTLLRALFPPYMNFYYIPHYRFIQGKPWLLPAAWIYRFYRGIRYGKLDDAGKYAGQVLHSDSGQFEREENLKTWGI